MISLSREQLQEMTEEEVFQALVTSKETVSERVCIDLADCWESFIERSTQ